MASDAERNFFALIETVRFQKDWTVTHSAGHRQAFWVITNPTGEFNRFPIPITYAHEHGKSFRLRVQQLGFKWTEAEKAYKDHLKQVAQEAAEEQRRQEKRLATQIKEAQQARIAETDDEVRAKPRWVKPRRYTLPVTITPEWALPYVTDMHGPSAREPYPEVPALTQAYLEAICSKTITDCTAPVVLDWNGRLLLGYELLLAVIEADMPIIGDVTYDVDPADYDFLNIPLLLISGSTGQPPVLETPAATGEDVDEDSDGSDEVLEYDYLDDGPTGQPSGPEEPAATEETEDPEAARIAAERDARRIEVNRMRHYTVYRMLHLYDEVPAALWGEDRLSTEEVGVIGAGYPDVERAVTIGNRMTVIAHRGRPAFSPAPAHTFAYLILRETPEVVDNGVLARFIDGALRGYGLTKGDPCAALHDFLYRNARPLPGARKRNNSTEQLMVLLKCWNAFMEGRTMRLTDANWSPEENSVACYSPAE